MPDTLQVVFHRPGPAWRTGAPFFEQQGVREHVAHYRQWLQEGRLLLGGPFLDGSGGMMVATKGTGRDALEAFAAADPAVQSGLLTFEVRPWLLGMSALPG